MPAQAPGQNWSTTATKQVVHGAPIVEYKHPGIAAKAGNAPPMYPTPANAILAAQIDVGDDVTIMMYGAHDFPTTYLPAGAEVGDALYIRIADNLLVLDPAVTGATDEIQTQATTATGGTVKLTATNPDTLTAVQSAGFAFTSATTLAQIQAILDAIVGAGNSVVTGSAGGPFAVRFTGAFEDENVAPMTFDNTSATGGTATVAQTTGGVAESIVKFGRVSEIDTGIGRCLVNLNLRDTF